MLNSPSKLYFHLPEIVQQLSNLLKIQVNNRQDGAETIVITPTSPTSFPRQTRAWRFFIEIGHVTLDQPLETSNNLQKKPTKTSVPDGTGHF